jgi:hypothetical protein
MEPHDPLTALPVEPATPGLVMDNTRSPFFAPHFGHSLVKRADASGVSFSNSWPQALQTYSYTGISAHL